MKLLLQNTSHGLVPLYDSDYENKKKLKIGEVYRAEIKRPRNLRLHRKYFSLINCAWEYFNEKQTAFFGENIEVFRKTVEVAAGHCDKVYLIDKREWADCPKSIAFDKMNNDEFSDLYGKVLDVLLKTFLKHISQQEFEENILNYL